MADGKMIADGSSSDARPKAMLTPKAVTIAEPEGIQTINSELGEPISNSLSQSTKYHRVRNAKRLSGRHDRPSLEQLPKFSSHGLTKSPNLLPAGHTSAELDQCDLDDPHSHLLSQVSTWLREEKANRLQAAPPRASEDADLALQKLEKIVAEHSALAKRLTRPLEKEGQRLLKRRSSSKKLAKAPSYGHPSDTEYHDGEPIIPSTEVVLDNSRTVGYANAEERKDWLDFKSEIIRLTHTLRLKGWRRVALDRGPDIGLQRISGALTNAVYMVSPPATLPEMPEPGNEVTYLPKRRPIKLLLRIYGPQAGHLVDREKELEILKRLARKKIGPRLLGTFLNGRFEQYLNASPLTPKDLRHPEVSKQIAKRMRELHDGIELTNEERSAGPLVWQNWDKWVKRCEEITSWLDEQIMLQTKASKSKADLWRLRGLVCGVPWASFRKAVENYRKWLDAKYHGKQGVRDELVFAHNDAQYGNILRIEPTGESPLLHPSNEHKQLVVIDFEYANANTPGLEFANHFTEWCYNYHSSAPWACNVAAYPRFEEQRRFIKAYIQHRPGIPSASGLATPSIASSVDGSLVRSESATGDGPSTLARTGSSSLPLSTSLASFNLDARRPPNYSYAEEEAARDAGLKKQVEKLVADTRLWRVANSALWTAWGIVQAKVQGMEEALEGRRREAAKQSRGSQISPKRPMDLLGGVGRGSAEGVAEQRERQVEQMEQQLEAQRPPRDGNLDAKRQDGVGEGLGDGKEEGEEDEAEFDYLAYAQDRALFLWGDLLELGLVKESELPAEVLKRAKRIAY